MLDTSNQEEILALRERILELEENMLNIEARLGLVKDMVDLTGERLDFAEADIESSKEMVIAHGKMLDAITDIIIGEE